MLIFAFLTPARLRASWDERTTHTHTVRASFWFSEASAGRDAGTGEREERLHLPQGRASRESCVGRGEDWQTSVPQAQTTCQAPVPGPRLGRGNNEWVWSLFSRCSQSTGAIKRHISAYDIVWWGPWKLSKLYFKGWRTVLPKPRSVEGTKMKEVPVSAGWGAASERWMKRICSTPAARLPALPALGLDFCWQTSGSGELRSVSPPVLGTVVITDRGNLKHSQSLPPGTRTLKVTAGKMVFTCWEAVFLKGDRSTRKLRKMGSPLECKLCEAGSRSEHACYVTALTCWIYNKEWISEWRNELTDGTRPLPCSVSSDVVRPGLLSLKYRRHRTTHVVCQFFAGHSCGR